VAFCSGLAPVEIARALGITPYFPENHAALIAATHQSVHYLAYASSAGFSQFSSSAMRSDIGAILAGTTPLTAAHRLPRPPRPDVVLYSTNTGNEFVRWFEYHGAHYGVPVFGLHPPPALDQLDRTDVDAAVHQLLRLSGHLERATGRVLDMDRLDEVVGYTAEAARLWESILDLACAVPSPITFFDTLVHMAPMVLMRGTPEAVTYYRLLKAEVEDRVVQGIGAVPGETQRFYWDGPPIWYALRPLAQLFAGRGIAVTAVQISRCQASSPMIRSRAWHIPMPPCSTIVRGTTRVAISPNSSSSTVSGRRSTMIAGRRRTPGMCGPDWPRTSND